MKPSEVKTVYVVEDDQGVREMLERVLGTSYDLRSFASGREALNALQARAPDVLLTDLGMPDITGEDLAWAAGQISVPPPRVVVMSGDRHRLLMATQWAHAILPKPFAIPALIGALEAENGPTTH